MTSQWQDISTAPKDGTVVLGAWPSMMQGYWYRQPVKFDDRKGWLVDWDHDVVQPTHWMPLPSPPEVSE